MEPFEQLGAFYLGRPYDLEARAPREGLVLYDSKDLVTHAVCVGMTGSGKTGLCLALIEEALLDGVPVLAIDPKGLLGDRAFDTAAWIHNAIPADAAPADARRIAERCIAQLAEGLAIERERIRAWAEAQAVLSGFWMVEDHGRGWEPALASAEMLATLER